MLVQYDQIDRHLFQTPIFVRAQKLADEPEMLSSSIRTSTMGRSPEMPWAHSVGLARAALEQVRGRPQRRIRIEDVVGEPLKKMRFVRAMPEMVQLHLRLGPGQRLRALEAIES